MRTTVLLHLHGESFARRHQVASHAIAAAAVGDRVIVVLWFDALVRWTRRDFDAALPGEDSTIAERHRELGLPTVTAMLEEARALGAELWACETAVRLAGLRPEEVRGVLDAMPGLQEILATAKEAALVLYV